jgi:hypothetical protein
MSSAISAPTSKHLHLFFTSIKLFTCRPDFTFAVHQHFTCIKQSRSPANVHQLFTCIKQTLISIPHASSNHVHKQTFISIPHASNHITTPHAHQQMARSQNDALTHAHHQTTKLHHDALTFTSRKAKQRHRRQNISQHSCHFHENQKAIGTNRYTAAGDKPK